MSKKKLKYYAVVASADSSAFANEVNRILDKGGELIGGVSVSITENETFYAQALLVPV